MKGGFTTTGSGKRTTGKEQRRERCGKVACEAGFELATHFKLQSRFPDFEQWGCAIFEAMNEAGWEYSPKGFLDAYYESPKVVSYRAVEGHPLAQCLQNLRDNGGSKWQGTPTALLKALNEIAAHLNIDTDQAMWPKAAHMLTRRLEEIKSSLVESGIAYNNRLQRTAEGGSPKRIIRLAFSQKKDNTIRDSAEDKS